jgi:membrane-associated protein
MLTAGGFAAAGDLQLWQAFLAAAAGGSRGTRWATGPGAASALSFLPGCGADPGRDRLLAKADGLMDRQGRAGASSFSRWLVSPLGPWVNLLAGSTGYGWPRFTAAGVAGEAVWAGLYVGTGYGFAGNVEAASDMLGSVLGMVGGAGAVLALGYWLFHQTERRPLTPSPLRAAQAALPSRGHRLPKVPAPCPTTPRPPSST